jgi:hypothetical protein
VFDAGVNAYTSQDLTELADHFWLGHTITRIAWAPVSAGCGV